MKLDQLNKILSQVTEKLLKDKQDLCEAFPNDKKLHLQSDLQYMDKIDAINIFYSMLKHNLTKE